MVLPKDRYNRVPARSISRDHTPDAPPSDLRFDRGKVICFIVCCHLVMSCTKIEDWGWSNEFSIDVTD